MPRGLVAPTSIGPVPPENAPARDLHHQVFSSQIHLQILDRTVPGHEDVDACAERASTATPLPPIRRHEKGRGPNYQMSETARGSPPHHRATRRAGRGRPHLSAIRSRPRRALARPLPDSLSDNAPARLQQTRRQRIPKRPSLDRPTDDPLSEARCEAPDSIYCSITKHGRHRRPRTDRARTQQPVHKSTSASGGY